MREAVKNPADIASPNSWGNAINYLIDRSIMRDIYTAEIMSIGQADEQGPDSKGGYASATPLVCEIDSRDRAMPQAQLAKLPFWRPQAGKAAILMRPQPGDKALAVCAKRDSSNVKTETKDPIPPASFRTFDLADGFLLNGFLDEAPETWLLLDPESGEIELSAKAAKIGIKCRESGDIEIKTGSGNVSIQAPDGNVQLSAGNLVVTSTGNIDLTANGDINIQAGGQIKINGSHLSLQE